jgi:hypothetical protein
MNASEPFLLLEDFVEDINRVKAHLCDSSGMPSCRCRSGLEKIEA